MTDVAKLQVVVGADIGPLERGLNDANRSVTGFGSSLAGVGGVVAAGMAVAGGAIAAGLAVGIKAAGNLEQAVANISTIKPEIDNSAVFASLNEMSTRVPQTAAQLGESLYNVFSSMDVGADEALALVETFSKGAVGAGTSAETFGTAAMGVMNAYKLSAKDAGDVSDWFFDIVNKGVVTGDELAASLGPVTQSAKAAGVEWRDLGPMIAAVTKEGGPAAQNINNLNNFLSKITTKEAQKELNNLGVATIDNTGKLRTPLDVLTDLKARTEGMTESARNLALQAIFPDAQARQGAMVLMSQLDMVREGTGAAQESSGSAAAAYEKMSATFNSQSALMMNGLMSILTTVGAMLLPVITPLISAFATSLPGAFAAAQAAIGPVAEQIAAVLAPAFDAVMAALPGIVAGLMGLFDLFSGNTSMTGLMDATAMLSQVFGPAATALILDFTALAGEALRAYADFVIDQFGVVVSWFQENWPLIQQTAQTVMQAIADFWELHGHRIIEIVQAAWTIVTTVTSGALQNLLDAVKIAMQLINGDWAGAWETLTGALSRNLDQIATILGAAFDAWYALIDIATGGMLTSIETWMTDTSTSISTGMDAVGTTISTAWEGVKTSVAGILPTIAAAIMAVWNQIPEDIRADLVLIATHLVTAGTTWVTNLTTAGGNMLTAISTALTNMVTAATTWATATFIAPILGLAVSTSTAMTTAGSGMLTAITTKLGEIVGAVTTWADSTFLAPLRGLVNTVTGIAQSIGSAIVNGIISGVRAMGDSLSGVLSGMVRGALNSAKAALGIESPSKVFALEIGQPIVQGVMQGLDSMSRPLDNALSSLVSPPPVAFLHTWPSVPRMSAPPSGMLTGMSGGSTAAGSYDVLEIRVLDGDDNVIERNWVRGKDIFLDRGGVLPGSS